MNEDPYGADPLREQSVPEARYPMSQIRHSRDTMKPLISALVGAMALSGPAAAQNPSDPNIEACRSTGLVALRERSPNLKDLIFDMETLAVSKANTKVEDVPVRTVIMGEAYLERKETGKSQRFVCLIGEKGKVLLTFFTEQ
jgi:hypothetical protein